MTIEKASEVLGDVRAYLASRASLENEMLASHTFTDICNAIKALEQQPCEDCISREAVIEWLKDKDIIKTKNQEDNARRELAVLPSVTPQQQSVTDFADKCKECGKILNDKLQTRWIPVSERLPEKTDYYLIQYSREVCPDEMAVAFYSVEEAEVDSNYTWEFKPIADCKEVIAWQPLPQPYKAESEDEE